jgi:membrane associated rhomboid family serine protease
MIIAHAPSFAKYKNVPTYNSLGASGAVAAIMFAAILFQPWAKIYLFGIIGVPGILLGPLYLFFEYRSGQQGRSRINHDAHFCGAIFGLLFTIALKPSILVAFIQTLMQGPSM